MTLTELHADPALLADYLCIPPMGQYIQDHSTYTRFRPAARIETAPEFETRVREAWRTYCHKTDTRKVQTHAGFLRECMRAEFPKLGRTGALRDCRNNIAAAHPDTYTLPAPPAPTPITWMHGRTSIASSA